uniref:Cytochrome P450 2K1-like n=1 Tax=Neogobius melanostomus TaxID=47308 RepID=A0A8C6WPX2_9GOBI
MDLAGLIQCNCLPVLGSLVVLLLVYLVLTAQTQNNEPPGPRPLPVLGNLLLLDFNQPYKTFIKLSKKYGSVFTFHMGPNKAVVLVGYKTVKEALVDFAHEFGERATRRTAKEDEQEYGVVFTNGETWREMRRFALTNLRDFGMGKKASEDKIIEECGHLLQRIKSFRDKAFDTHGVVNAAVSNIICSMVYGSRFDYDEPEFKEILYRVCRGMELLGTRSFQLNEMFPSLGKWLSRTRAEHRNIILANRSHYLKMIDQLTETLEPQVSRGVVDAFLIKRQQLEEAGQKDTQFHRKNLTMMVSNLFAGGTETTACTLRWSLLFMAKHPKIQDQVREEISRVIGARQVQVEDRKNLPFTDAVIHETQRLGNIFPLSVLHRTSCDVIFKGHFIKKGTTVYTVLASVLYDENEWEKPHSFYPAHFLDQDGKFVKRDAFMPFSAGRRACPGEALARMELFIIFVTLMQHFRFTPPPGVTEEELDLTPQVGGTRCPLPHQLCATSLF